MPENFDEDEPKDMDDGKYEVMDTTSKSKDIEEEAVMWVAE